MKQISTSQSRISKHSAISLPKQHKNKQKSVNYLQLSNEEFLRRNLMLLGATEALFQKQTKSSIQAQFFPKHQTNPTGTKQFFYISYFCLQKLSNSDQLNGVQMWYPPRTVNQQVQYKKAFFKAVQNLEMIGRLPKNIIVSKGTIMGDSSSGILVQFLRFLSQMALRHQYLQKYSKRQRLIQVCINHSAVPQNSINKFYIHPFVPSPSTTNFDHPSIQLNSIKQTLHNYLKIYLKKLVKLRTKNINPILAEPHQKLMRNYMEQKQLSMTLDEKIPASLLSQNRAFDRRRLIDKNQEIWAELQKIQCNFIQQNQVPILKLEGQIDQILQKWQPIKGISNIIEVNSSLKIMPELRKQVSEQRKRFRQLCDKIEQKIQK